MANTSFICRRCLIAYTALVVAMSGAYLGTQWGVHESFTAARAELEQHNDGSADLTGTAFAESGGAEYLLVTLFFFLHLACLCLFLSGARSALRMAIGCAVLLACTLMYVLFFGCMILLGRLEEHSAFATPEAAAARQAQAAASKPYRVPVDYSDGAIAAAGAAATPFAAAERHAAEPAADAAAEGTCGAGGGAASAAPGEAMSYGEMSWTVLETLVDVLAAMVGGSDAELGEDGLRHYPDGTPMSTEAPFAAVRQLSLLALNGAGFALSVWGVMLFDFSPAAAARMANPALTSDALSRLAAQPAGAGRRSGAARGGSPSPAERAARAAAALADNAGAAAAPTSGGRGRGKQRAEAAGAPAATAAGQGAKKNQ